MYDRVTIFLFLPALTLSACADRGSTRTTVDVPANYQQRMGIDDAARVGSTDFKSEFPDFHSAVLKDLLSAIDHDNADIGIAIARIGQADAKARQAGAALLPSLDFNPNGTGFAGGARGRNAHEIDWSAAFVASYELDLWGRVRAQRESASAAARVSRADLAAVRMTARAGVATLFFRVQSLRERSALARENLKSAQDVLAFLEARAKVGLVMPAELASQRSLVAAAQIAIPELDQQRVELLTALAVMVGRNPEGFDVVDEPLQTLSEPIPVSGLPVDLLTRRPDLVAAEEALKGAHADLLAARAAFLPDVSLSATGGVANPAVNAAVNVLAGTGYSFTLGADLVQSIFDGGRRRAIAAEAEAKESELLLIYRAAIRSALADVETALAQLSHLDQQRDSQDASVADSVRAFEGWSARYHAGAAPYLSMLEAQRTLIAVRDQRAQYRLARLQAIVDLNKAMGGNWENTAAPHLGASVSR
jgi:multidrug efflux system outer membrane protein